MQSLTPSLSLILLVGDCDQKKGEKKRKRKRKRKKEKIK